MAMDDVEHVGAVLRPPRETAAEDFFQAVEQSGALPLGVDPAEATSVVLCALLSRLDLGQARVVLDAIPPEVRAAAGQCPIHGGQAAEALRKVDLLARVAQHLQLAPDSVEPMIGAVLRALRAQLPPRPTTIVERTLPRALLALWRGGARH